MKKLNAQEILDKLQDFPNWNFFNNGIEKHFIFKDFITTMQIMNAIAEIAEAQNHHPEWNNVYNKLHIRLTTHDCDGVSDKDFKLAEAIEKIIAKHFNTRKSLLLLHFMKNQSTYYYYYFNPTRN